MSPYPPFPLFTFIGFAIHALVFYAIGIRFLKRWNDKTFFLMGVGSFLDGVNFTIILVLFFLFPNSLAKSNIFLFNASIIVPFAVLSFVGALVYFWEHSRKFLPLYFIIGSVLNIYLFISTLEQFRAVPFEASYVHPAFPALIGQSQSAGIISSVVIGLFFFYNAFLSTLFIKRRALILGFACILEAISTVYWTSSTPGVYIFTHTVGPIASLMIAYAIFAYAIPHSEKAT
ncbi:MAG: hypothetical protein AAB783_01320 [Patescibacteria group bacterium]